MADEEQVTVDNKISKSQSKEGTNLLKRKSILKRKPLFDGTMTPLEYKRLSLMDVALSRYWRDIFCLVTGSRVEASDEDIKNELRKHRLEFVEALKQFECNVGEKGVSFGNKYKEGNKMKDPINKLAALTGASIRRTWESMSVYLMHGFRGSGKSFRESLKAGEKGMKVLTDIFCFHFRERQFMLRTWHHILAKMEGYKHSVVYKQFAESVTLESLYEIFLDQLAMIVKKVPPDTSSYSSSQSFHFTDLWIQYQLSELIILTKLLIICAESYSTQIEQVTQFVKIFAASNELRKRISEALEKTNEKTNENRHESQFKNWIQLLIVHFIQLIDFQNLEMDGLRWMEDSKYQDLNTEVDSVIHRGGDFAAIIFPWILTRKILQYEFSASELSELWKQSKKLNCWKYYGKILESKEMEDFCISTITHKHIYYLLYMYVEVYGTSKSCNKRLLELAVFLLRDSFVNQDFWLTKDNKGLKAVVREAEQRFPVEFHTLMDVYTSLAGLDLASAQKTLERLNTEVPFCEKHKDAQPLKVSTEQYYESSVLYQPLEMIDDIKIAVGTKCILTPENYIQWNITLPFWKIVHNAVKMWTSQFNPYPLGDDETVKVEVLSYLKFTNQVLKSGLPFDNKTMIAFVEDIFCNLSRSVENLDSEIIEPVLILAKYTIKAYPHDTIIILETMKVIPAFKHIVMEFTEVVQGQNYHTNAVKAFLELVELRNGNFPVLIAYLDFIRQIFEVPELKESWTSLAGLVFVLTDVLPEMHRWYFSDNDDQIKIKRLCFDIIKNTLNLASSEKLSKPGTSPVKHFHVELSTTGAVLSSSPTVDLMGSVCLYSLLNSQSGIAVLRFISMGEQHLFNYMETLNCWLSGRCKLVIDTLFLALTIANRVLQHSNLQAYEPKLSHFETEIFKEPRGANQLHVVLHIASYIYLAFSSRIRYLALNLLTGFANKAHLSLYVCLGMDADILRHQFLHPLYSEVESESMKIAVIRFATECIEHQPSLAEAFLNVNELKSYIEDSVNSRARDIGLSGGIMYMVLSIIKQTTTDFDNKISYACATLLEALWKEKKSIILSFLRVHSSFFHDFTYVVFTEDVFDGEIAPFYSKVFSILAKEIYCCLKNKEAINKSLRNILKKLVDSDIMFKWSKYCIDPKHRTSKLMADPITEQGTQLLRAWKNFLGICLKKKFPMPCQKKILFHIVDSLEWEICSLKNPMALELTADIFLIATTMSKRSPLHHELDQFIKITKILEQLAYNYKSIQPRTVMIITTAMMEWLLGCGFCDFPIDLECHRNMIEAMCTILTIESQVVIKKAPSLGKLYEQRISGVLCLTKSMMEFREDSCHSIWQTIIENHKLIPKIITATAASLKKREFSEISLFLLELLIDLFKIYPDTLRVVDTFELRYDIWEGLLYPDCYLPNRFNDKPYNMLVKCPWTPIYIRGLHLVSTVLRCTNPVISLAGHDFFLSHTDYISETLLLPKFSVEHYSLDLVRGVLLIVNGLLNDTNVWSHQHVAVLQRIIANTKTCVNEIISLLNSPDKIIKRFEFNRVEAANLTSSDLFDKIKKVQVGLLQTFISCMTVLNKFSLNFGEMVSCHRVNMPLEYMRYRLPLPSLPQMMEQLAIYLNAVRLFTRILSASPRILSSPTNILPVASGTPGTDSSPSPFQSLIPHDEVVQLLRLVECPESNIRLGLQLSLYVLLADVAATVFFKITQEREHHILIREFLSEMSLFSEFICRYRQEHPQSHYSFMKLNSFPKKSPPKPPKNKKTLSPSGRMQWWGELKPRKKGEKSSTDVKTTSVRDALKKANRLSEMEYLIGTGIHEPEPPKNPPPTLTSPPRNVKRIKKIYNISSPISYAFCVFVQHLIDQICKMGGTQHIEEQVSEES